MSWMIDAACRNRCDEMIAPVEMNSAQHRGFTTHARTICASCPVRSECLEYVLRLPSLPIYGVWAGHTSDELAAIRRRRLNEGSLRVSRRGLSA